MKGGAVSRIPPYLIPETYQKYVNEIDLKYITGHGRALDNVFVVPPNTYILNLATSGKACMKLADDIESMIYNNKKKQNPFTPMPQILYDLLKEGKFLKDGISEEHMYDPMHSGGLSALYSNTAPIKPQKTIAFYEPGDIMPNTYISMWNDSAPYFLLGVYNLPLPNSLSRLAFEINNRRAYVKEDYKYNANDPLTISEIKELVPIITKSQLQEDNNDLLLNPQNEYRDKIKIPGTENVQPHNGFTLHQILTDIAPFPYGKTTRIIFVKACRVTEKPEEVHRLRRFSVGARTELVANPDAPAAERLVRSKFNLDYLNRVINSYQKWWDSEKSNKPQDQQKSINETMFKLNQLKSNLETNIPVNYTELFDALNVMWNYSRSNGQSGAINPLLAQILGLGLGHGGKPPLVSEINEAKRRLFAAAGAAAPAGARAAAPAGAAAAPAGAAAAPQVLQVAAGGAGAAAPSFQVVAGGGP